MTEKLIDLTKSFNVTMAKWRDEINVTTQPYKMSGERGDGKTTAGVTLAVDHAINNANRTVMLVAKNPNSLAVLRKLAKSLIKEAEMLIAEKYTGVEDTAMVVRDNMQVTELANGSQIRYNHIGQNCRGLTLSYIFADFEINLEDERIKEFWVCMIPCVYSTGGKIVSVSE